MTRVVLLSLCLLALNPALASTVPADYHFDVYLDDKPIGTHSFVFDAAGDGYRLTSTASYQVKFLFVTAYQYRHESTEQWRGGCLRSIDSTTDDNGDSYRVEGDASAIRVNGEPTPVAVDCVRSFVYWDPRLLESPQLLNSQTGELEPVTLDSLGQSPLPWGEDGRPHQLLSLATPRTPIELWYDSSGRWLGLRSELDNGRVLSYRPAASASGAGEAS